MFGELLEGNENYVKVGSASLDVQCDPEFLNRCISAD